MKFLGMNYLNQRRSLVVWALIITIAIAAIASLTVFYFQNQGTESTIFPSTDSAFFLEPNVARVEATRQWFMSPFNFANEKVGYDPTYGLIRGGFWNGGFQNGFVIIDSQLLAAKTLDYFNSLHGLTTRIEANMRTWLANTTWIDPSNYNLSGKYQGNDRREIMFGKVLPCVMDDSGQVFYAPGHTLSDPIPVTTALTNFSSCTNQSNGMNTFAIWIELYYLEGNINQAKSMFSQTVQGWTPTPNTGINGTTGGYFSDVFDSGPAQGHCKSSRALEYWIHMARATGFWNLNSQTRLMALQVMDELWAHQLPDGGISVNYPGCGNDRKSSGESSGLALLAFDPRVTQWFNTQTHNSSSQSFIPTSLADESQRFMAASRSYDFFL